jgi:hypothetical protein
MYLMAKRREILAHPIEIAVSPLLDYNILLVWAKFRYGLAKPGGFIH